MTDDVDVTDCRRCSELCASRSRIVNGVGPTDADLLFVGEAPGETEDEVGEPFVGRSGDVLDEGLRDRGLSRRDIRITNCVRCRPPDNRDPTAEERSNCRPYLDAEIAAVDPDVVVALGKVPAEHLLDRSVAVTEAAGAIYDARIDGTARRVLVCVHPAATLYDPSQREQFDAALDAAVGFLDDSAGGQSRLGEF
ncbi:uracil-DNA glycosylase [Natronomonas pharaonis DSM 2160]|uniref:Type-4 uracil-DNA glycosylase n=1 Tax=Natronomonas pharaonis (strain ATCC 35678 / DSM 2160 / CIP 103997 / JCM 8858 / NBRC 14720 / NCIMB 2260 / Gabara) TaxID=348780 RepID=A0A1U7ETC3_NATPD|nr:uracil-DNA glycosylase [Natronomonas pharaonis]CAI48133.1 uracil-DNA glycosylase [Natronomonas pharaonis DSM 2160]